MNADQGSQFSSQAFAGLLKAKGVRISMDCRGTWHDNIFVECLWQSVKYEEVYLHAYDSVAEAQAGLVQHFHFHNNRRLHSSLAGNTPDQVYFHRQPQLSAA